MCFGQAVNSVLGSARPAVEAMIQHLEAYAQARSELFIPTHLRETVERAVELLKLHEDVLLNSSLWQIHHTAINMLREVNVSLHTSAALIHEAALHSTATARFLATEPSFINESLGRKVAAVRSFLETWRGLSSATSTAELMANAASLLGTACTAPDKPSLQDTLFRDVVVNSSSDASSMLAQAAGADALVKQAQRTFVAGAVAALPGLVREVRV